MSRTLPSPDDISTPHAASNIENSLQKTEEDVVSVSKTNTPWDSHPRNPYNWKSGRKWGVTFVLSLYMFVTIVESSIMAPALPEIGEHFHITNQTVIVLTLSIYLLAFAFSPLLYAPISEMYGRYWVLQVNMILFLAFNVGCIFVESTGSLVALRFLSGWVGSVPLSIGSAMLGDIFPPSERAIAMAVFTLGGLVGPVAGPIAGGFLTESAGFKYIFVVLAALSGVACLVSIPLLRETYGPVLETRYMGNMESSHGEPVVRPKLNTSLALVWINMKRPFFLLTRSLICFVLSVYSSAIYGMWYLMFTTFPVLFADIYHFNTGTVGLAYLGLGVGFVLATLIVAGAGDWIFKQLVLRNHGQPTPEMRIPLLVIGSFFIPIGLFWYGWSIKPEIHWIVPIIGTGIFGFGLSLMFQSTQLYLIDAFGVYGASALSAAAVIRSLFSFAFPLFGSQLYAALGNGGGNSLLGGIAIVIGIPFPIWLWFNGESLRKRTVLEL